MDAMDRYLLRLIRRIHSHGWVVVGVFPDPQAPLSQVPFQYTVGLSPKAGFEIIIIGLSPETGASVLNDLAARVVRGARFTNGQVLTDVLADDYTVTMLEVADASDWTRFADQLYRRDDRPLPVWQVVYPDLGHRMPGDPGYTSTSQPLLAPPPRPGHPGIDTD